MNVMHLRELERTHDSVRLFWNESKTSLIACFEYPQELRRGHILKYYEGIFEVLDRFDQGKIILAGRPTRTPKDSQEKLISEILHHIRPGTIALDVGANIGGHALAYARAGARVFAFEPNPKTYSELCRNTKDTECICYNQAVGSQSGDVFIECDPEFPKVSHICDHGERVRLTTLDELYGELRDSFDAKGVSVVKIDVEGFEPKVLIGAAKLISKFRAVIVCEVQYNTLIRNGFSADNVLSFLDEHGYEIQESFTDPRSNKGEHYLYDVIATPK
jgi:FkbM family methyltransferase